MRNANREYSVPEEVIGNMLRKLSIPEIGMSRLWRPDENELADAYAKACNHIIRDYIKRYDDCSLLKDWLPQLGVTRVVDFWRRYPESTDYEYASESERETVDVRLYKMKNLMLHLHRLWYWRNPEEMIDTLSSNYLITLLESYKA